jgi:glycosyltransferase involved in cell wall biosynthesis
VADLLARLGFDVDLVGPPGRGPAWLEHHGASSLWQARAVRTRTADGADLVVTTGFLGWPGRWGGRRVHVFIGNMVRQAAHLDGNWHWRLRWGACGGLAEAMAARGATVIAGSPQAAEDAARLYRAKIHAVVPLGVDLALFRPRDRVEARSRLGFEPDGVYGLFVGRGEPGKGPTVAVEACRRAGFQLLSAGARPVAGSIPLGVLPAEELAWAYAAADAMVLPTRYEGFGYASVEALACGVPAVTTPTGWARELGRALPEYSPLLVPPEPAAVAAALCWSRSSEARAATQAARAYVLRHNSLAAFESSWTELLAGIGAL